LTAKAAASRTAVAGTATQDAQWTAEANATLTAAATKESMTETAVWAGETATSIAFQTLNAQGSPTPLPTATPTATPSPTPDAPATATAAARATVVAGYLTELLSDDPPADVYACAQGPDAIGTLHPFLLDVRQLFVTSDGDNMIVEAAFDPAVGDLGQAVARTNALWIFAISAYDPSQPLPAADPNAWAADKGNVGFTYAQQGTQSILRSFHYVDGAWQAETIVDGMTFVFGGSGVRLGGANSARLFVSKDLLPAAGQFSLELYNGELCDRAGVNGGPTIGFLANDASSANSYLFAFSPWDPP
jgi:hypothetical protein